MDLFIHRRLLALLSVGFVLLQFVMNVGFADADQLILFLQLLAPAGSWLVLWVVSRRHTGVLRRFWFLLSVSNLCYLIAMVIWGSYQWFYNVEPPAFSLADLFWNAETVIFVYALYDLMSREKNLYQGMQAAFDTILYMLLAGTMGWHYLIYPSLQSMLETSSWWVIAMSLIYPVSDLGIIFCLIVVFFSYRRLFPPRALLLMALGFVVFVLSDCVYSVQITSGTYDIGNWLDPFYDAALLLLALAGLYSLDTGEKRKAEATPNSGGKLWKVALAVMFPYACLSLLLLMALERIHAVDGVVIGGLMAVVIMAVRQVTVLIENRTLLLSLKKSLSDSEYMAYHDVLSGLPNRRCFEIRLEQELHALEHKPHGMLAILFLDLDRFKYMNDSYGHGIGDQLIRSVAERLAEEVDPRHVVSRQGGDEFTVLLTGLHNELEAFQISERIIRSVAKPFYLDSIEFLTTTSIGISTYPKAGRTSSELMKHADTAMYKAKSLGGNRCYLYTKQLDEDFAYKAAMEHALRKALLQHEFVLFYQPQIEIASGAMVGVEALIRWRAANGGYISPMEFIPLAEETGVIIPMGEWVLRTACIQAVHWMEKGLPPIKISVNVSPRQFEQEGFVETVAGTLRETGLPAGYLILEITEGIAMRDQSETISKLRALKQLGLQVAMDDFGTGYSSLRYLQDFQVDILKIDKSFIHGITSGSNHAILEAMLAMARSLRLTVMAEGVETEEQYRFLKDRHCDYIQGYYFYKPLPAEEAAYIGSERSPSRWKESV